MESVDPFSHESFEKPSVESFQTPRSAFLKPHQISAQAHLYPIDESDDFHDPFSDLSLFLSKKIKQEIDKHGSIKHWSSKIESHLIAGILPEFKLKFPKYRLGVHAIKKVWEKVSYYYDKIQGHAEAIKDDGKLNIEFMIKENLKGYPFIATSQLPPYHTAHQIAVKMSECIAALDGDKPKLEVLTKTIWAVQKHLVQNLPTQNSKNAYEDYDSLDKMIVKMVLEKIAKHPLIPQRELQEAVTDDLSAQKKILKKFSSEATYHILATFLAKRLYSFLGFHSKCSSLEKIALEAFIKNQQTIAHKQGLSSIESSQRIVALYPLCACLPKKINATEAKMVIHAIYEAIFKNKQVKIGCSHPGLFAIIQAEMHFLKRKEVFKNLKKVEECILETLMHLQSLPAWKEDLGDDLEVLFWTFYQDTYPLTVQESQFFKDHIQQVLFECPQPSFKTIMYQIQDCLKKTKLLLLKATPEEELALEDQLKQKTYLWSIQHEMICRWLRFDESTPLLQLIQSLWKKKTFSSHENFLDAVLCEYMKSNLHLNRDPEILKVRLQVMYKYFWYHHLADSQESSLERFLKYHYKELSTHFPEKSQDDLYTLLEHRIARMLPLTPLSRKCLSKTLG